MSDDVKRRHYTSAIRKEQAEATRVRIVEAAGELFTRLGYGRTTVKQIADAAGVAADTVYATFKTKGRVLTALIDRRLTAGEPLTNVMERPEALAVREAPTQRNQIAAWVAMMRAVMPNVTPAYEIMRNAASVDEEIAAIYTEMQGYRAANARVVAGWIAEKGPLRLGTDEVGDVLWGLSSPELAMMLTSSRGWSQERYWTWLEETLVQTLLVDA